MQRRNLGWRLAGVGLLAALLAPPAAGQPAAPAEAQFVQKAIAAKEAIRPISAAEVSVMRERLVRSMSALESRLRRAGRDRESGWKTYLKWDALRAEIDRGAEADLALLRSVHARMTAADAAGLELDIFTAMRDALRNYLDALFFANDPQFVQKVELQLDRLAEDFESLAQLGADSPREENALMARIGERISWLERARQAAPLVAEVRRHWSAPNLHVRVAGELVNAAVQRDVDDTMPVVEVILGTTIYADAHTVGEVTAALAPADEAAIIEVLLRGVSRTNGVGYKGPVKLYNTGVSQIEGRKQIVLDADGLKGRPATATASTSTTIHQIVAPRPAIERFAWRRAALQKAEAEWIAAQRAAGRVVRRMESESRELLDQAAARYQDEFRKPLVRQGEFPSLLNFSTSKDWLRVTMLKAGGPQLGARSQPSAFTGPAPLAVRVHQSVVGNFAEAILGGMTLTDERLAEILEERTGEVPEELQIMPDKDPWSITFAAQQPVAVAFGKDVVTLSIRGRQFTRGDQLINEPIEISAAYDLAQTPSGVRLVRQGEVEVEFLAARGPLNIRQVTFKTFLQRKFAALMKPEFEGEGFVPPGRWEHLGRMVLSELASGNGWLELAWDRAADQVAQQAR